MGRKQGSTGVGGFERMTGKMKMNKCGHYKYVCMYVWNCQGVKRRNKAKEELLPQKESVATQRAENRGEYQKNTTQIAPRGCQ